MRTMSVNADRSAMNLPRRHLALLSSLSLLLACGETTTPEVSEPDVTQSTTGSGDIGASPALEADDASSGVSEGSTPEGTSDVWSIDADASATNPDAEGDAPDEDVVTAPASLCARVCSRVADAITCSYINEEACLLWCEEESSGPCGESQAAHFDCLAEGTLTCDATGVLPGACFTTAAAAEFCAKESLCETTCDALSATDCARAPLPGDGCKEACLVELDGGCTLQFETLLACAEGEAWTCNAEGLAQPTSPGCAGASELLSACQLEAQCKVRCATASQLPCASWPDEAACLEECATLKESCPSELAGALSCHGEGLYACDGVTQDVVPLGKAECAPYWDALSACSLPVLGPSCPEYCNETEALQCHIKDGEPPEPDVPACTASCLSWKSGPCSEAFNAMLSCNGDAGFICLQEEPTPSEVTQCSSLLWDLKACLAVGPCTPYCAALEAFGDEAGCAGLPTLVQCEDTCASKALENADCEESFAAYIGCVSYATDLECSDNESGYIAAECADQEAAYKACAGL